MNELVEWLRSVLADDEKAAKAASDTSGHDTWVSVGVEPRPGDSERWIALAEKAWKVVAPHPDPPDDDTFYELGGELFRQSGHRGLTEHIARHDPVQVLARVQADRKILELHEHAGWGDCAHSSDPCPTLRALARVYRHRPGWQDSWGE